MHNLSIAELSAGLREKKFSSRELTEHYLKRIKAHDGELNSFITVTEERALKHAEASDARIAGDDATLLTGTPLVQMDIFCTLGFRPSCTPKLLASFTSPFDTTILHQSHGDGYEKCDKGK